MSGYWQAIERVLRGEPASAQPRPRSRFEDVSNDPVLDPCDLAIETEAETQPPATPPYGRRALEARQDMRDLAFRERVQEVEVDKTAPATDPEQRIAEAVTLPAAANVPPRSSAAAEPIDAPATRQVQASPPPPRTDAERVPPAIETETIAVPLDAVPTLHEPSEPRRDADAVAPVAASAGAELSERPEPVLAQPVAPISVYEDEPDATAAQAEPPAPSLTIEIGEIQIRVAPEGFAERVVPLRAAKRGRTASLEDFLAREAGAAG